ncbi:hypothetical protein D3C87_1522030 [compost metagenome]
MVLHQDVGIGKAFQMRLIIAHDAIEVRALLVGLAFAEGMAGLALAHGRGAAFGAGAGQQHPKRHFRFGLGNSATFGHFRLGQGIAGATILDRVVDGFGEEPHAHDEQQGAEHGADDLV